MLKSGHQADQRMNNFAIIEHMNSFRKTIKEHLKKISDGKANCYNCVHADNFTPRSDEPSAHGCRKRGIEGYVLDPYKPPCILRMDWQEKHEKSL